MPDTKLEKLGDYFVHFNIRNRYGITFGRFVELVENGIWESWMNS